MQMARYLSALTINLSNRPVLDNGRLDAPAALVTILSIRTGR
jgi:hypothetical protein